MHRYKLGPLVVLLVMLLSLAGAPAQAQAGVSAENLQFSPPLGFRDGQQYGPHDERDDQGNTVEDTRYGVQNPDLAGPTCFGVAWERLYHSGQDLYRSDGASTAGAEVTAVADGTVVYANPYLNYPGLVIIIEHTSGDRKVYSVYAHLDDNSLEVSQGQQVTRGQRLATVMYQHYSGRFPERHPSGNDSHLHFELRYFYSGKNIYGSAYPACNGLIAGRGYTYPEKPDDFPQPGAGYINPDSMMQGGR